MAKTEDRNTAPGTKGRVLHQAAAYDLTLWLAFFGREHAFRERVLSPARLAPGETVLDVGCGTGTLAIAAKRRVGASGTVHGIDASSEMIARAISKARKARAGVTFTNAVAEALPFAAGSFDAVLSVIMLHHLPKTARLQCLREIRRVLKPGGRLLAVDFEESRKHGLHLFGQSHRRHGHVKGENLIGVLSEAGLVVQESGPAGIRNMHFALATAP